ncbi:MAG: AMP-binding protein [Ilumatobacteraceae bacterium]
MGYLLASTIESPDEISVIAPEGQLTWRRLEDNARRVARALAATGVGVGGRWAILSRNRLEWPELYLGNVLAGARYVPVNWHLTSGEIEYYLRNSGSTLLVVDPSLEDIGRQAAHKAGLPGNRVIVLGPDYEQWRDLHEPAEPEQSVAGAPLIYTGGTTGPSKGVTRADVGQPVSRWVTGQATWGGFIGMPDAGRSFLATPLYHAFGAGLLGASMTRRHTMVIRDRFDPIDFLDAIARESITSVPLVPTLMVRLAKLPDAEFTRRDLSMLEWVVHTAAPCPPWAKALLIERLGPIITEFYGSSEGTGPVVCTSEQWLKRPGTVGRPAPNLAVSVVDDDGQDLQPGQLGTLYFKRHDGPPEYHGAPDKTAASRLADGRFTVGDLGYVDDEGYVFLVDRRIDLIISGGVNIYPAEIEGVLSEHPAVRDVAVFGIPHPEFGQDIKAAVECETGTSPTEGELIEWCRERLASFKVPRSIEFHPSLPREAHGKLKKRLLRDAYWPDAT